MTIFKCEYEIHTQKCFMTILRGLRVLNLLNESFFYLYYKIVLSEHFIYWIQCSDWLFFCAGEPYKTCTVNPVLRTHRKSGLII
jgi:hypothetical protein